MRILKGLKSMKLTPVKLEEGTFLNVDLNESQSVTYKVSPEDLEVVNEMVDLGGYASALLYLNENCSIYINKFNDIFESEKSILDYYADCSDLLKVNNKVVNEMGRPLCSIRGYNIFESEKGILRGNGKNKILENFKLNEGESQFAINTNVDPNYQFLSDEIDNVGEANDWLKVNGQKMMQENSNIDTITLYANKNGSWDIVNKLERNPVNESVDDLDSVYFYFVENGKEKKKLKRDLLQMLSEDRLERQRRNEDYDDIDDLIFDVLANNAIRYNNVVYDPVDTRLSESVNSDNIERVANDIFDYYKEVEFYDFFDNYNSDEEALESLLRDLQSKDGVQKYLNIFKNEELNDDISAEEFKTYFYCKAPQEIVQELTDLLSVNECEGTQTGDIASKVDYPQSEPVNPDKKKDKYYDLLLSQMDEEDESFTSKGFYKGTDGVYRRGNYVLVKEGEHLKILNKKLIREEC